MRRQAPASDPDVRRRALNSRPKNGHRPMRATRPAPRVRPARKVTPRQDSGVREGVKAEWESRRGGDKETRRGGEKARNLAFSPPLLVSLSPPLPRSPLSFDYGFFGSDFVHPSRTV